MIDRQALLRAVAPVRRAGTTILAVIASPLEHGVIAEGVPVAFDFPPGATHLLSGSTAVAA